MCACTTKRPDIHRDEANAGGASSTHLFCRDGDGWRFVLPSGFSGSQVAIVSNGNDHWNGLDSGAGVNYAVLHGNAAFVAQTVHGLIVGQSYTLRFLAASHSSNVGHPNGVMLALNIDGVKTWQSSLLSPSAFEEFSVSFTAKRTN